MEKINKKLSPFYKEHFIQVLRKDISMHLSLLLSEGYRYMPNHQEELLVNAEGVHYSDLNAQKLKTPQVAIILLEVADFLYNNSGEDNINTVEGKVVQIPESYTRIYKTQQEVGGLFGEKPIMPSVFCLSQAFHLLRGKLIERQTGLFHVLFLKTCLMLEQQGVPPDFLLGNEYSSLKWLDFVKRYLIGDGNDDKSIIINIDGIELYPTIMDEIYQLYGDLYITRIQLKKC